MREFFESVEREYRRYKKLGEGTFEQLSEADLAHAEHPEDQGLAARLAELRIGIVAPRQQAAGAPAVS